MSILIRLAIPIVRTLGEAPHVESFSAQTIEAGIGAAGFTIVEATRHGSKRKNPRVFIVARNYA